MNGANAASKQHSATVPTLRVSLTSPTRVVASGRYNEIDTDSACNNRRMAAENQFEARLANGEVHVAESLWGARHIIARHVAFDTDPLNPGNVLPAEIWKTGQNLFGGRVFVEKIFTAAELSTNE
jgi:hypothetical protein